jgi:hypothetical protein
METTPNTCTVSIRILHKETNKGLPGLLVVLLDIDNFQDPEIGPGVTGAPSVSVSAPGTDLSKLLANYAAYNRLFSGITDADGKVTAGITPRGFNTGKESEQKPDLLLLVLAPEEPGLDLTKRLLYLSNDFRVNAASEEAYIVRLGSALLKQRDLPIPEPETTSSVQARISAYQTQAAEGEQFRGAILEVETAKTQAKQNAFLETRDQFKTLLAPLPINSVGSNFSTFIGENEKVKDKFGDHYVRETVEMAGAIQRYVSEHKGIEVSFVLNKADRDALGFDPTVLNPDPSGPQEFDKSFTNIQTDPVLQPILAKMNAAGADNVVLTSNNPIIKKCLTKSDDTVCATDSLGLGSSTGTNTASKVPIGFNDLPLPAQQYLNSNNGGAANLLAAFKLTDTASTVTYEARVLPDTPLHFDSDGINTDNNGPMTAAEVAVYVKRVLTDIRTFNSSAQTTAGKSNQDSINDNVNKFSLRKGPAELPSFYDFQVLNIAFGHIWKQLTDDRPAELAAQASQLARDRGFVLQGNYASAGHMWADFTSVVSTMSNPPESVISNFDITYEEWNALDLLAQNKLSECSTAIDYANKGLIYQPASTEIVQLFLTQNIITRPAGYYNVRSADAAQYVQKLKDQGELLIDYVRNGSGKSFHKILTDLDSALRSNYAFTVFGADETAKAVNFGLLNTYRQKWEPVAYQVGNLVKSIPLAPKEERKYSLKTVFTRKRTEKEAKKNNTSLVQEENTTSRAEEEIVAKAQNKNTFSLAAEGSYGSFKVTSSLGLEASKESSSNRKDFRESVLKATQEFKEERSVEVDTERSLTSDYEESGTINNPNDELAVTYLFYELQKRFKVSEQLYRVMPTVLVAQDVPSPNEITEAWVITHDWIINRAILDDSFRPALAYISQKNVGDDFAIRELRKNLRTQRQTVEALKIELAQLNSEADNRYAVLEDTIKQRIRQEQNKESDSIWDSIGEFFGADNPTPEAAKAREMAARDAQAYAADKAQKMSLNLQREMNTLQAITAEYTKVMQDHLDKLTMVERLLLHIKENILYYMQAIWELEPADQRYMRLMNIDVPQFQIKNMDCVINQQAENDIFKLFRNPGETLHKGWIRPVIEQGPSKPLVEVADLDTILGFRGNYMIFPMKQHNAITEIMAMPYVDASFGAMDPDQLSNVSLEDYARYVCCLRAQLSADEFNALKDTLKGWLKMLLEDPLRNGDEIIVPTSSLYIEMLLSANTLLEDFKLFHREWDVYKVQEEVQLQALENLRVTKRILEDKLEDPKVDKKILVEGGVATSLDVDANN